MPGSGGPPFRSAEEWLEARRVEREVVTTPRETGDSSAVANPRDGADGDELAAGEELGDVVAKGLAYVRRSTAVTPRAEARVRAGLEEREYPAAAVELILVRARAAGLVDDTAFARALVEQGRAKRHAIRRLRHDLLARGFPHGLVDNVLAPFAEEDPSAAAFAAARSQAERLRGLPAETAFRRLVGYLARRGYDEALARKVARQAVFDDRQAERTAGR